MTGWTQWLPSSHDPTPLHRPPRGVEAVRQEILSILDDCAGTECERLRWRLHTAECAQDLWMLRGPLFQVIASQHCQAQAAERVNGLQASFQEILPRARVDRVS
jgi:hypothetical protein